MRVLTVTNMYPEADRPAFGTFVFEQVNGLRAAGIEVDVLFINGRKNAWNYLWGIPRMWEKLLRVHYDLIHAHYALTGMIARLQFQVPVVVTYHGGEVKEFVPFWLRFLARKGPALFDRIIVVNQQERAILQDHPKTRIIPCGVDLDLFKPISQGEARQILGLPAEIPLVLWAGEHWQYEKRFELVKDSVTALKQKLPEAELIVVSNKPHAEIPVYMNACDVLLLTSRSEGSPMVIKEAMACNLPIVSTDVGDVAEIIAGVEGCSLADPDAETIADRLNEVLRVRNRTNGRDHIQHLSIEAVSRRIIDLYNEIYSSRERIPQSA